jgi:hypothetical protein
MSFAASTDALSSARTSLGQARGGVGTVSRTGDEYDPDEHDEALFWAVVVNEHPVCVRHQLGDFAALKLSDFVSRRQLHESRLYDVWFRPGGIEHELNIPIPSPLWHTKTFLFDRGRGRDFTERDRLVLDRLQPHLARLWRGGQDPAAPVCRPGRPRA